MNPLGLNASDIERLWTKVNKTDTCWLWTDAPNNTRYGVFAYQGTSTSAHRATYSLIKGAIPDGLVLDHLCRVRLCVNPDHLEPVTVQENRRRSLPTICIRGHELTPENTWTGKHNRRACLKCHRELHRLAEARRRQRLRDQAA